jgi:hypothetical protein
MKLSIQTGVLASAFISIANMAMACDPNQVACIPNQVPGVNVPVGTGHYNDYIPVLVCNPWWDQLWGDSAQGTRWWGPTMTNRSGSWKVDLKPVKQKCKWFHVRPGGSVTNEVSCLDDALVTTGPITEADRGKQIDLHQ